MYPDCKKRNKKIKSIKERISFRVETLTILLINCNAEDMTVPGSAGSLFESKRNNVL